MARVKKEASKKDRETIKRLAKAGKVVLGGDLSQIDLLNPDFTVTKAELLYAWHQIGSNGFTVKWETVSGGFGETTFYTDKGKIYCDNETMSKFFVMSVLMKLLDTAELTETCRLDPDRVAKPERKSRRS